MRVDCHCYGPIVLRKMNKRNRKILIRMSSIIVRVDCHCYRSPFFKTKMNKHNRKVPIRISEKL